MRPQPSGFPARSRRALSDQERYSRLIRDSKGMWPADAIKPAGAKVEVLNRSESDAPVWVPDQSLIRGEWYFTHETSSRIASLAGPKALLAGTPSIAEHLPRATLVESSPWAARRLNLTKVEHHQIDFESFWTEERFDFVALDPPWYFPALVDWVHNAAVFSSLGSTIAFPLFGEGARPSAPQDRQLILSECATIGGFEVISDSVEYETPRFELEALKAAGIHLVGPWRRSDLVILTVERIPDSLRSLRQPFDWVEMQLGTQLIAVRTSAVVPPPERGDELINPVPGTPNWVMDSVSRRDPRWQYVNVWSSSNRVAYTPDPQRLITAVEALVTNPRQAVSSNDADVSIVLAWMAK